jgi:CHAT domain-containing protein/tetratricopeptide (TPR) repeat protein
MKLVRAAAALAALLVASPSPVATADRDRCASAGLDLSRSTTELVAQGDLLLVIHEPQCAERAFTAALERPDLDALTRADALAGRASAVLRQRRLVDAEPLVEASVAAATASADGSRVGRALIAKGRLQFYRSARADARQTWRDAEAAFAGAGDEAGVVEALADLSIVLPGDERKAAVERGSALAERLGNLSARGRMRQSLGDLLFNDGNIAGALDAYIDAERDLRGGIDTQSLAVLLTSMGRVMRLQGQARQALEYYREGLALQRQDRDLDGMIQTENAMGVAYSSLRRYGDALAAYQRGLALARQTQSDARVNQMLGSVATAYMALERPAEALTLLEEVLKKPIPPYLEIYRRRNVARVLLSLGRAKEAMPHIERAFELMPASGSAEQMPFSHVDRALIREALGDHDGARADAREALGAIERLRTTLPPLDFLKQGFIEFYQTVYGVILQILAGQGRFEEALGAAEQARSRAFADLVAASRLATPVTADDAVPVERGAIENTGAASPLGPADLAALARRLGSTVVAYWASGERSFAWVVTQAGEVHGVVLATSPSALETLVRSAIAPPRLEARLEGRAPVLRMRGAALRDVAADPAAKAPWRSLYGALVAPIDRWLPSTPGARLTVIPHGPLLRLPFAALTDRRGRYLVERYAIHYAPAGSVLALSLDRPRAEASNGEYVLVADPARPATVPGGAALPTLPASRREVSRIASATGRGDGKVLVGNAATERAVRQALPSARVVHFATHAIVSDQDALGSFLSLSRPAGARAPASDDGRITSAEVYGLRLGADLVVLSACRSGRGPVSSDGTAGLARAFLTAGAPRIVTSLWDVADEPASLLMPTFHAAFSRGTPAVDALRRAQLDLIRKLRRGQVRVPAGTGAVMLPEAPLLWAGFILTGAP